jgi:hypothetical protein
MAFLLSVDEERAIVEKKLTSPTNRISSSLTSDGKPIGWAGLSHIDLRNSSAKRTW